MQAQFAEAFCLTLRLGRTDMVSMPSDYLPRRVDWAKWIACIASGARILNDRVAMSPRICLSPDHQDPKDNIAIASLQGQSQLESVDPMMLLSDVGDGSRFLFVGSWTRPIPTWFSSLQSVFNVKYGAMIPEILSTQMREWGVYAEKLEKNGTFLVSDDMGRLSALTAVSRVWRARQIRSGMMTEARTPSWFASVVDIYGPKSSEGIPVRLHRLAVIEPERWCGSPQIDPEILSIIRTTDDPPEIWISAPGIGVSLWIADQQQPLAAALGKLRMPGTILGWHPLRDIFAFLSHAPSGSMMYCVDQSARLQVLKKDQGEPT